MFEEIGKCTENYCKNYYIIINYNFTHTETDGRIFCKFPSELILASIF